MPLSNKKTTIGLLLALQFLASVSMSMVFALAPTITTYFNIPSSNSTFLNIGFVSAGLLSPLFGYTADRKGTKSILIIGAIIFVAGHLMAAFSSTVIVYFAARFFVGLGYSSILGLNVSYLSKYVDHSQMGHTSAFLKLAFALGVFISPIFAATIVNLTSFKFLYLLLFGLGLLLVIGLFAIPNVKSAHQDHLTFKDIQMLFKDKVVLKFLTVSLATSLPGIVFFNFFSIFLSEHNYSQVAISSIYTMIGIGSISSAFLIFFLNKRFGMTKLFKWALWWTIAMMIPMLSLMPWIVIPISVLFALGYDTIVGLINPVLALRYHRQSGTVIMMFSLLGAIYGILVNVFGPFLYQSFGFAGMIVIGLLGAIGGSLALHSALKEV